MRHNSEELKSRLIRLRRAGATLVGAAGEVGVHVATVCRWQTSDPVFRAAMRAAGRGPGRPTRPVLGHPAPVADGPLARGLPVVPCARCGADGSRAGAVLAVRAVAALPLGELAAAAPAGLPAVRRTTVLVPLPKNGLVPPLRNANDPTLAGRVEPVR